MEFAKENECQNNYFSVLIISSDMSVMLLYYKYQLEERNIIIIV